jgi:hypothetical protein
LIKKLFILFATLYFLGQVTGAVDLLVASDNTPIECTGECESGEEEVKEGALDAVFLKLAVLSGNHFVATSQQLKYYFQDSFQSTLSPSRFSPPPEAR